MCDELIEVEDEDKQELLEELMDDVFVFVEVELVVGPGAGAGSTIVAVTTSVTVGAACVTFTVFSSMMVVLAGDGDVDPPSTLTIE